MASKGQFQKEEAVDCVWRQLPSSASSGLLPSLLRDHCLKGRPSLGTPPLSPLHHPLLPHHHLFVESSIFPEYFHWEVSLLTSNHGSKNRLIHYLRGRMDTRPKQKRLFPFFEMNMNVLNKDGAGVAAGNLSGAFTLQGARFLGRTRPVFLSCW